MHETAEDLARLQELLDRSYASAGEHLLRIHTPERRLTAEQVCERLQGMSLLALATVSSAGGRSSGRWTGSSSAERSTSARHPIRSASATSRSDRG